MSVLQLQTNMGHTALVSRGYALATNYKANQNIEGKTNSQSIIEMRTFWGENEKNVAL